MRKRVVGCDYPAIVPDGEREDGNRRSDGDAKEEASCVRGTYVEGLTDSDIWRLDIFEGEEYERIKVRCRILGEGEEVEAETYVWREEGGLESGEWDFEVFVREKMGKWVGGREEFEGE